MIKLRNWQEEAKEKFKLNNYKGIIKAATGTGKTILAVSWINDFKGDILLDDETFLIVVPTTHLQTQWHLELTNALEMPIGKIGNGFLQEEKITVAIINSVRERKLNYKNLILDEIHNYASDVNSLLLENNEFKRIMGLSATPERTDLKNFSKYGLNIIYEYSTEDAINNKDLCDYEIMKVGVLLSVEEALAYEKQDKIFKEYFQMFKGNMDSIYKPPWSLPKMHIRKAIRLRNEILAKSEDKINKIVELIKQNPDKKVIVFAQYIYSMKRIYETLKKQQINSVIYGDKKDRKNAIQDFKDNKVSVMISAKALDEGLNVPGCDMAIIMAGHKTERQVKQRLGRVLRKKDKIAVICLLYCRNTKDEDWLKNMLRYI